MPDERGRYSPEEIRVMPDTTITWTHGPLTIIADCKRPLAAGLKRALQTFLSMTGTDSFDRIEIVRAKDDGTSQS